LRRTAQRAQAAVTMNLQQGMPSTWDRDLYPIMHCYGFYCERKSLRLFCMLHCHGCADCKKHAKTMHKLNMSMGAAFFLNILMFCVNPNFGSFSAMLVLSLSAMLGLIRMFRETNKMLAWIDKRPIRDEGAI